MAPRTRLLGVCALCSVEPSMVGVTPRFSMDATNARAISAGIRKGHLSSGLLMAVNLGDNADTTGAGYGQIADAYYGEQAIPGAWRMRLAKAELNYRQLNAANFLRVSNRYGGGVPFYRYRAEVPWVRCGHAFRLMRSYIAQSAGGSRTAAESLWIGSRQRFIGTQKLQI